MPGRKNQRRAYKDSVFVDLFARCPEAKENFLSLYNAMHGTKLTAADTDVEPVMLEQTIYTGRYNDVSMLVDGKVIKENLPHGCGDRAKREFHILPSCCA